MNQVRIDKALELCKQWHDSQGEQWHIQEEAIFSLAEEAAHILPVMQAEIERLQAANEKLRTITIEGIDENGERTELSIISDDSQAEIERLKRELALYQMPEIPSLTIDEIKACGFDGIDNFLEDDNPIELDSMTNMLLSWVALEHEKLRGLARRLLKEYKRIFVDHGYNYTDKQREDGRQLIAEAREMLGGDDA